MYEFLEVPTEGRVLIDGKALGDLTEKELRKQREEIGMIFQHFNLLMQKSVIDNVCFPLYIKGRRKRKPERERQSFWKSLVWETDRMLIRHSFPVVRSRGLPLQEHLHRIRRSYFVMSYQCTGPADYFFYSGIAEKD